MQEFYHSAVGVPTQFSKVASFLETIAGWKIQHESIEALKKKKAWISWKTFAKPLSLCIPMVCITLLESETLDKASTCPTVLEGDRGDFPLGDRGDFPLGERGDWTPWRAKEKQLSEGPVVDRSMCDSWIYVSFVWGKYLMLHVDWCSNVVMKSLYTRGLGISGVNNATEWFTHIHYLTFCINGRLGKTGVIPPINSL